MSSSPAAAAGSVPAITLYHVPLFRSTRALWMFYELKQIYGDRIPDLNLIQFDPNTFRTNKPAEYLVLNPNGKVPCLVHGDIVMWDSSAICMYLLEQWDLDNVLAPKDPKFRASMYKLAFYCSGTIDNLTATSSPVQMVLVDKTPGAKPALLEVNKTAWLSVCGPALSKELADSKWMAGDKFTALDVFVGYSLGAVQRKTNWFDEKLQNLPLLFERMKERPAFQKATNTGTVYFS